MSSSPSLLLVYREILVDWLERNRTLAFVHLGVFSIAFLLWFASSPRKVDPMNPSGPIKAATQEVPAPELDPPKDDLYTAEELKLYDGSNSDRPVYVAIKGTIFDVTPKRDMYEPGKGYNLFAGKDASRALGKSSLNAEDAVSDYSTLDASELKVLDDWVKYYTKRYSIVGKVQSATKL